MVQKKASVPGAHVRGVTSLGPVKQGAIIALYFCRSFFPASISISQPSMPFSLRALPRLLSLSWRCFLTLPLSLHALDDILFAASNAFAASVFVFLSARGEEGDTLVLVLGDVAGDTLVLFARDAVPGLTGDLTGEAAECCTDPSEMGQACRCFPPCNGCTLPCVARPDIIPRFCMACARRMVAGLGLGASNVPGVHAEIFVFASSDPLSNGEKEMIVQSVSRATPSRLQKQSHAIPALTTLLSVLTVTIPRFHAHSRYMGWFTG